MGEGFASDQESGQRRDTPEAEVRAGLASGNMGAVAAVMAPLANPQESEVARLLDAAAAALAAGRWRQARTLLAGALDAGAALPEAWRERLGKTMLAIAAGAEADGDWKAAAALLEPLLPLGIAAETASARLEVVRRGLAGTVALSQAKAAFAAGRWQESLDAAEIAVGALPTNLQARELSLLAAAELLRTTRRRQLGSLYRAVPTTILLLGITAASVWGGQTGEGPAGFLATMPPLWESIIPAQPNATPTLAWTSTPLPTPSRTATASATATISATSTRSAELQRTAVPVATTPAQAPTAMPRQPTNAATRVLPAVPPANTPLPAATATRTPAPAPSTPVPPTSTPSPLATKTPTRVPPGTPPATAIPPRVPPGTPPAGQLLPPTPRP